MSEYLHVEKPFLDQLKALGWTVIDQGQGFIPTDPTKSLRSGFREWLLPIEVVAVRCTFRLSPLDDGRPNDGVLGEEVANVGSRFRCLVHLLREDVTGALERLVGVLDSALCVDEALCLAPWVRIGILSG